MTALDPRLLSFTARLRARAVRNYFNPDWEDQPREPAGSSDGGQWTTAPGTGEDKPPEGKKKPSRVREAELHEELQEHFVEWDDELTLSESEAFYFYTGSGTDKINGVLRGGRIPTDEIRTYIEDMDASLDRASLPRDVVTYRGLKSNALDRFHGIAKPSDLVGKVIRDEGFISTSIYKGVAASFAAGGTIVEIRLPKGYKAAYLGELTSSNNDEGELLIPRGSKFRVAAHEKYDSRTDYYVLEPVAEAKEHANFNPNQPRAPKGSPAGGEWTDGGKPYYGAEPPGELPPDIPRFDSSTGQTFDPMKWKVEWDETSQRFKPSALGQQFSDALQKTEDYIVDYARRNGLRVDVERDRGGSRYIMLRAVKLKKDGTPAKNQAGVPLGAKIRISDHPQYYGATLSIDPYNSNTATTAIQVIDKRFFGRPGGVKVERYKNFRPDNGRFEKETVDLPERLVVEREYTDLGQNHRPAASWEKLVDFATIKTGLDAIEERALKRLLDQTKPIAERLIKHLQKHYKDPDFTKNLKTLHGLPALRSEFYKVLREAYDFGAVQITKELSQANAQREYASPGPPRDAIDALNERSKLFVTRLDEFAREVLIGVITAGLDDGSDIDEMTDALRKALGNLMGDPGTTRGLEAVVRTNVTHAFNKGRIIAAATAGAYMTAWIYSAILDTRTTPVCRHLDGTYILKDDPRLDRLVPPRHYNCFLNPRSKFFTPDGWKGWSEIRVGDRVLTHQGRFRRVSEKIHHLSKAPVEAVTISYRQPGGRSKSRTPTTRSFTVTLDHPLYLGGSWLAAGDVRVGDKLTVLCPPCEGCGTPVFWWRSKCPVCAPKHKLSRSSRALLSASLRAQYRDGRRDRKGTVSAANEATRKSVLEGRNPLQREEVRSKASQLLSRNNYGGSGPELALQKELGDRGLKFETQYRIPSGYRDARGFPRYFWADFAFVEHKLLVEVDGWRHRASPERDEKRDEILSAQGWDVLRFDAARVAKEPSCIVDAICRVLSNHSGKYAFSEIEISGIRRFTAKPMKGGVRLYNLAVDEDESYVGPSGVVMHNCRSVLVPVLVGDAIPQARTLDEATYSEAVDLMDPRFAPGGIFMDETDARDYFNPNWIEQPRAPEEVKDNAQRRSLYVCRPVENADAILAWAKGQGFTTTLAPTDLHATVCYSKEPMDWETDALPDDAASRVLVEGGDRSIKRLGDEGAVVLRFESAELARRWKNFRDAGASWDFPGYQPHVTITYDPGDVDLTKVEPYRGPIEFGPEKWEEIRSKFVPPEEVKVNYDPNQPRAPKGSPLGGRWVATGARLPAEWDQASGSDAWRHRQSLDEAFAKSPPKFLKAISAVPPPRFVYTPVGLTGYRPDSGDLNVASIISTRDAKVGLTGGTFRHEYGHHFDRMLRREIGALGSPEILYSSADNDLSRAIDAAAEELTGRYTQAKMMKRRYDYQVESTRARGINYTDNFVDDLLGALSSNAVGHGHPIGYISVRKNRNAEVFANLFELYGRENQSGWTFVKKNLPDLAEAFEGTLDRLLADKAEMFEQRDYAGFDPNQPRDPRGSATGGQWSDGDALVATLEESSILTHFKISSEEINEYLRKGFKRGQPMRFSIPERAHLVIQAFERLSRPLLEDLVMYRGIRGTTLPDAFLDKGFTSLTLEESVAKSYAGKRGTVYRFVVPKGTRVLKLADHIDDSESEYLPPPGSHFIRDPSGHYRLSTTKENAQRLYANFNPNQPRGPKGSPQGGEWVDDPNAGASHGEKPVDSLDDFANVEKAFKGAVNANPVLTHWERKALKDYAAHDYDKTPIYARVNKALRSDGKLSAADQKIVSALDNGFARAKGISQDTVVYRSINFAGAPNSFKEGSTFTDKAFVSTSTSWATGADFQVKDTANHAMLRITVPKGSKTLAVTREITGKSTTENEVVLPRNSRFRVVKIESRTLPQRPDPRNVVHLELLDDKELSQRSYANFNPNQPRAKKGDAKGGQWIADASYNPGVKVKKSKNRAWEGETVELETKLSKQEAGALGERILIAWLRKNGMKDASPLNVDRSNFPVDLVQDHELIEAKTGLVSNRRDAQKWRATIGQPGKKETAWLKRASAEEKAEWNQYKQKAIIARKRKVLSDIGKQVGKPFKGTTMTVLLNPDTKTADIFRFNGFHTSIRWGSPEAQAAYVGSVSYD